MKSEDLLPKNSHVLHVMTEETLSLIDHVSIHAKISKEKAQELITMGAVYLEKIRITENKEIKSGSYLRIHSKPRRYDVSGIDWKACIVFENADFVILNKPAGVPVPSTVDNLFENTAYQVSKAIGAEVFVTQRLDRPTSGLLVLAKTKKFQSGFNKLLLERKVHKLYTALTEKAPPTGLHSHFIEDSKSVPKKISDSKQVGYLSAELKILESKEVNGCELYESRINLLTGRTHQIRAQLSYLGYPLLGDVPYGGKEIQGFNENKIGLRAVELKFLEHDFSTRGFSDELENR